MSLGKRRWISLALASALGLVAACDNGVGQQASSPQIATASLNEMLKNAAPVEVVDASIEDCTLTIKIDYPVRCVPGDDITLQGKIVTLILNEFRPAADVMLGLVEPEISYVQMWPADAYRQLFRSAQDAAFAAGAGNYELGNEERRSVASEREIEILDAAGATSRTQIKMCSGSSYMGAPSLNEMRVGMPPEMASTFSAELGSYIDTYCNAE